MADSAIARRLEPPPPSKKIKKSKNQTHLSVFKRKVNGK